MPATIMAIAAFFLLLPAAAANSAYSSDLSLDPSNIGGRSAMPTMPPRGAKAAEGGDSYPEACYDLLESFDFPTFEVLVTAQVVLPVFYSFFIPCVSVFILECSCRHRTEELVTAFRRKLSTILVGSWVHWYMHWELWSWFWCSLAVYFTFFCAMPPRFYEYSIGLGTTSAMLCLISNMLSDYRLRLKKGKVRILFNLSCFFLMSWILRFAYPCIFNIGVLDEFDFFWADMDDQSNPPPPTPPPPEYSEVVTHEEHSPPPTYAETLSRIRAQLPKLQRSISLHAQRLGRGLSLKRKQSSSRKKVTSRSLTHAQKQLSSDV